MRIPGGDPETFAAPTANPIAFACRFGRFDPSALAGWLAQRWLLPRLLMIYHPEIQLISNLAHFIICFHSNNIAI